MPNALTDICLGGAIPFDFQRRRVSGSAASTHRLVIAGHGTFGERAVGQPPAKIIGLDTIRFGTGKAATLQEQDGIERELSELERKQRRLRQDIFAVEDEIIAKLDELIASLQQRPADEGVIEKQKKPAGYIVKQSRLFE